MEKLKQYLLDRLESDLAIAGFVFLVLELLTHMGNVSTLVLLVCIAFIALPESALRTWLRAAVGKIKQ